MQVRMQADQAETHLTLLFSVLSSSCFCFTVMPVGAVTCGICALEGHQEGHESRNQITSMTPDRAFSAHSEENTDDCDDDNMSHTDGEPASYSPSLRLFWSKSSLPELPLRCRWSSKRLFVVRMMYLIKQTQTTSSRPYSALRSVTHIMTCAQ